MPWIWPAVRRGQPGETPTLTCTFNAPRALQIGAKSVHIEDLREDFLKNYILPSIQANGIYENLYLMGTSLGPSHHRAGHLAAVHFAAALRRHSAAARRGMHIGRWRAGSSPSASSAYMLSASYSI